MKKSIFALVLCLTMLVPHFCFSISAAQPEEDILASGKYEVVYSYKDVMLQYYQEYVEYSQFKNSGIEIMTFDEYVDMYYELGVYTISQYNTYLCGIIDGYSKNEMEEVIAQSVANSRSASSSSGGIWYDVDDGLRVTPRYGSFDFSQVVRGDILYEDKGFEGLTGHIALVDRWAYDMYTNSTYLRVIESVDVGVHFGVLDDDRFVARQGMLLRVIGATESQREGAFEFCNAQLGKKWSLQLTKPTDINHPRWQCSTMVWAAYQYVGINVEQTGLGGGPGVTPHDVRDASTTAAYLNYN